MKRPREDLENSVPSRNSKKTKTDSAEESPNTSKDGTNKYEPRPASMWGMGGLPRVLSAVLLPYRRNLQLASLDPAVVERLLKLDKILTEKGKMETQLLSTPKRERMALLRKWEESQVEIEVRGVRGSMLKESIPNSMGVAAS